MSDSNSMPTVVSFFGGDKYYYDCVQNLQKDCQALGVQHDFREMVLGPDDNWAKVCRKKIGFYKEMLAAHPGGILWLDVDTRLVKKPQFASGSYDFGAFLRNFKDLRTFDPEVFARTFHPGFLHFSGSERSRAFVDFINQIESTHTGYATDDFFLEEGYRKFSKGLSVHVFDPGFVSLNGEKDDRTVFLFGASGNVSSFKNEVIQHKANIYSNNRKRVLLREMASAAIKKGKRAEGRIFMREAHMLDPKNKETSLAYARLELRVGEPRAAIAIVRAAFGTAFRDLEPIRVVTESYIAAGNFKNAEITLSRLNLSTPEAVAFKRSREFRIGLEKRAAEAGLKRSERPKVWWMETPFPGNFGDVLNAYIVEKLSGKPPIYAPKGEGILAIGSVIKFAKKGTIVWGSGTPRMTDALAPDATYKAVRGPLTADLVAASGAPRPVVFGDPALLMPLIYNPPVAKKHRLGLIRHFTHKSQPLEIDGVHEIDILRVGNEDTEAFIDEMLACETIISSSLHGLILAHAYGIPTARAIFSKADTQIPGDGTKFSDHYLAAHINEETPLDLSLTDRVTADYAKFCLEKATAHYDPLPLLAAAPFKLAPEFRKLLVVPEVAE